MKIRVHTILLATTLCLLSACSDDEPGQQDARQPDESAIVDPEPTPDPGLEQPSDPEPEPGPAPRPHPQPEPTTDPVPPGLVEPGAPPLGECIRVDAFTPMSAEIELSWESHKRVFIPVTIENPNYCVESLDWLWSGGNMDIYWSYLDPVVSGVAGDVLEGVEVRCYENPSTEPREMVLYFGCTVGVDLPNNVHYCSNDFHLTVRQQGRPAEK